MPTIVGNICLFEIRHIITHFQHHTNRKRSSSQQQTSHVELDAILESDKGEKLDKKIHTIVIALLTT